jgi:hypothetical protein
MGLVATVAELLVQDEGPLQQVEGPGVVSQPALVPAEVGERDGSADVVAEPLEDFMGASGGVERIGLPALDGVDEVAVVVRPRLTGGFVPGPV